MSTSPVVESLWSDAVDPILLKTVSTEEPTMTARLQAPKIQPPRIVAPSSSTVSSHVSIITPSTTTRNSINNLDDSLTKEKVGRWSDEEHQVFLAGLEQHGKQWKTIAMMIGTRTVVQVRTHAQKYFQRLERHTGGNSTASAASKRKTSGSPIHSQYQRSPTAAKRVKTSPRKAAVRATAITDMSLSKEAIEYEP